MLVIWCFKRSGREDVGLFLRGTWQRGQEMAMRSDS